MEKLCTIDTQDKHRIYGMHAGGFRKPLVIILHGMACTMDEVLYERGTAWFQKHGYATYRFNFYDWREGARQLKDMTFSTHVDDFDAVVQHFKERGVKRVYVTGHSFAGPVILASRDQAFDAASLWDPSYGLSFSKRRYNVPPGTFVQELDGYVMPWGVNPILSSAMVREVDSLSWDTLPAHFKKPLHICVAEKGVLMKGAHAYMKKASEPKKLTIVKGATHYFNDRAGMQERVYRESERWFSKYQ